MKCPCCGKELTIGQELLYKIEDVYYCPHCLVKITHWPGKEREGGNKQKTESEEAR